MTGTSFDTAAVLALLPWVLPPLLGAAIGYVTNALAIRMLFRPLRRWRLFGIPIPLTPGVIPRRRGELAESIGRMVSRELLTADVFTQRFGSPSFRRGLQRFVVRMIDATASMTVAEARRRARLDEWIPFLARTIGSSGASRIVEPLTDTVIGARDEIAAALTAAAADSRVLSALEDRQIDSVVDRLWPTLIEHADTLLHADAVQAEMHVRARRILHYSLDQLSSLQRLFVSAAQYDRQLESRIPSIVARSTAEILQAIESPGTRAGVASALRRWVAAHRDRPVAELVGEDGVSAVGVALRTALGDRRRVRDAIARVADGGTGASIADRVQAWALQALDDNAQRTLGDIVPTLRRRRAVVGRWAAEHGQQALESLTTSFLGQLDIHRVVVDRVDDLDIEQVEGLLLGIIRRHLKWINVFGALLGALIGGVQVALRFLGLA